MDKDKPSKTITIDPAKSRPTIWNLPEAPIPSFQGSPTETSSSNIGDAQIGSTDFGESKYDKNYSASLQDIATGDYKYSRGEQQNSFAQLGLGIGRAISKAAIEVAKTPGYAYALGASWGDKTLDQTLDNAWLNGLEGLDQKIKDELPVYQSYKSGKGGILDNITSTSFWASDGADGVGYLLGMMVPGAALKAVGMAGKIAKLGASAKFAANLELGTQTVLNSSLEAMAEAKGVADTSKDKFKELLNPNSPNYNPINPKTGQPWKQEEIDNNVADAAYNTFMANMGLLMIPNAIMNKNLLGRFSKDKSLLDNFVRDASGKLTSNPIAKKGMLKEYAKSIGSSMASEGLMEEGGQTAIQNYEQNKALGKTNKGFIEGVASEYVDMLGTLEGQKAVLLGSVLGSLGGAAGTYREDKATKKALPSLGELIDKNFAGFSVDNDVYKRDNQGNIIINPKTNEPVVDIKKATDTILNYAKESKLSQEKDIAALANDKTLHDYIASEQFTRYVIPFIQQGEAGLQILNEHLDNVSKTQHLMNEESIAGSKGMEFEENKYKTDLKNKAKELSKIYDSTMETVKGLDFLTKIPGIDPEVLNNHINTVANAIFQENSKQLFLTETIYSLTTEANQLASALSADLPQNQREIARIRNEVQGLNNLLEQSKEYYNTLFDPIQHEIVLKQESKKSEETKVAEQQADEVIKTASTTINDIQLNKDDIGLDNAKQEILATFNSALITIDPIEFNTLYEQLKESGHLLSKAHLDALEAKAISFKAPAEPKVTTEVGNDQDLVSSTITTFTNTSEGDATQLNNESNRTLTEVENQKGVKYSNSYVAMKMFDHVIEKVTNLFKWKRNADGFPKLENNSGVDVSTVNNVKVGDVVTLKLVTLNDVQNTEYLNSKKENGVYDEKHIGIYSNGNLIGFVPQAHSINPSSTDPELSKQLFKDLVDYRKAVIAKLIAGQEVNETVTTKGNGNLYTKLTEKGNVDLINKVLDTAREKDKLDDISVFVYSNGEILILPENSDMSEANQTLIKNTLSNFKKYGKAGKVYQMVQDLTGSWAPIPVYAERMDVISVRGIMAVIKTLDNTVDPQEIVKALNDYIYASTNREQADLFIKKSGNNIVFTINGDEFTLDRLLTSTEEANEFMTNLKSKRQNININKVNNPFYQKELKVRGTLATNVTTFEGEYFVQPYIEHTHTLGEKSTKLVISDIEAKKTDIERRRQEELNKVKPYTGKSKTQADSVTIDNVVFKLGEKVNLKDVNIDMDSTTPNYRTGIYTISMISINIDSKNGIITLGDGNELITPKISDIINAKYDAELDALEEPTQEQSKSISISKFTQQEMDDAINNDNAFSKKVDLFKLNRVEFKKWLSKNLPQLSLSDIDKLTEIKDNSIDAFGMFKDSTIYLFEDAGNKTAYHEAFHGVFRNLLSQEKRFELVEEIATEVEPPSDMELHTLQEGLKDNYSKAELTYLFYEEKLADKFADFSQDYNTRSLSQKIKDFFMSILRFFKLVSTNDQTTLEQLFESINKGEFKYAPKVKNDISLVDRPFEKLNNEYAHNRKLDDAGFPPSYKQKFTESIGNQYLKQYQDNVLLGKVQTQDEIFKSIYNKYTNVVTTSNDVRVAAWANKIIQNFNEFKTEATKFLSFRGVSIKDSTIDFTGNLTEDNVGDVETQAMDSREVKGFGDWTSISGLNTSSARIKLMLSSIPVLDIQNNPKKDMFGLDEYYDFNKLYYKLEGYLTDVYDLQEQIDELKRLAVSNPQIGQIVKILEIKPSNMDDNQFAQLQNDFKTNFSKQQMAFSLVKFDTNSTTGEIKFRIMESNRLSIGREVLYNWEKNLEDDTRTNTISEFTKEGTVIKHGTKKAKDVLDQWNALTKRKDPIKYEVAQNLFTKVGIDFSPVVLINLLKTNSNEFKDNVTTVLNYYANPSDKTEPAGRKALSKLVSYETDKMFESYTSSFNNVENKVVYSIQLPTYASKILNKLRSRGTKFRNQLEDFKKDPFYKYSNILKELETNRDLMKLSYLDGLKDEKGESKGSKFTNMTPKDFLAMEVALFQNMAANVSKQVKDSIHKYVYITPSDKTMGMIFDAKSYKVNIEEDGRSIAVNSEIVGKFYNVFLQEVARIKHNLDIKNDILTNKNKSKYSLDVLLEHYHVSKKNFSTLSEFALRQTKGEELSNEDWIIVETLFDGQAYKWNYFSESFNNRRKESGILDTLNNTTLDKLEDALIPFMDDILKGITKELTKEFKSVKKEFLDKGLIKFNSKTNLVENSALDLTTKEANAVHNEINNLIAKYSLNSFLHNIEFSNILNGDIATYKPGDIQKRTYQSQAMTYNLNFKDKTIKTMVVKDYYVGSEEYDSIVESFKKMGFNSTEIEEFVGKYKEGINVTDAQVYITPELYKKIKEARGEWTAEIQEAYDIAEGKKVGKIDEAYHRLLGGIKPYYFGNRFDEKLGIQRYEQVKCAILPLFKSYTDMNPLLASKRADMELSGAEMMAHESSFKAAIGNRNDITGEVGVVLELDANNFGIQVDNPDHIIGGNDSMRQLKMLIIGSIDPTKTYKGVQGDAILASIMKMEAVNIRESFKDLQKKMDFKNNLEFAEFIKEMITKRGATINVEEALNIVNGDFEYALDNGSLSTQIENMISSIYTNRVIKQEFAIGGNAVQASSIGVKYKNLAEQQANLTPEALLLQQQLKWHKPDGKGGVTHAECIMPAWTKEFFNSNGKLKNINNIPDELRELIAYRIPTEGLHSIPPIKVVAFLPETMGNFILLPYEVTVQLGADFDFDKIYFIGREFFTNEEGNFEAYSYIEGNSTKNKSDRYYQYSQYTRREDRMTFEDFEELSIETQNSRASRNNKIVDNYQHLLTSEENLHLLISPSGFSTLEEFRNKYFLDRQKDNFFSSRTQRNFKERNHIGISLKGQSALHVTGHAYGTLMNLSSERLDKNNELIKASAINFNGESSTNFSGLYTKNNKLIADELSSIMAAILDDIKSPLLEPLGINNNTIDVLAAIIRSGYNMETALQFIAQPGIKEMSALLSKNKNGIKEIKQGWFDVKTQISIYKANLTSHLDNLEDKQFAQQIKNSAYLDNINEEEMPQYLNYSTKGKSDAELAAYYAFQIRVLTNFDNISVIAKGLGNINKFYGINKEVGPNIEDMISKRDIYEEILQSEIITGFDITKIPALEASYEVLTNALSWFENYFPYSTPFYMEIKKLVLSMQSNKKLSQLPINDKIFMNGFIRTYMDQSFTKFTDLNDKYNHLFKLIPSQKGKDITLPTLLKNIKNSANAEEKLGSLSYEAIKNNTFINEIKLNFDKNNKIFNIMLKGNRLDLQVKNNVILGFKALYKHPDTKQLAIDLINHSFISNGFAGGLNSYAGLIGPDILKDLGYNEHRKGIINNLKNNLVSLDFTDKKRIIDQMIRNNPKPFTKVFDDSMFGIKGTVLPTKISTSEAAIKDAKREADFILGKDEDQVETPMYIRVYDKAAKRAVIYKQGEHPLVYERITNLGRKGFFVEVSSTEDIERSYLGDNNSTKAIISTPTEDASNDFEEPMNEPTIIDEPISFTVITPKVEVDPTPTEEDKPISFTVIKKLPPIDPC